MRENRVLFTLASSLRTLAHAAVAPGLLLISLLLINLLLVRPVHAQQLGVFAQRWTDAPPAEAITAADVREALMWTGHLDGLFKGDLGDAVRRATLAWQKSRNHAASGRLTAEQTGELIEQALAERDAVGWATLRDSAVGFAVGVPAKLVSFGTPRSEGGALVYAGSGEISQSIGVNYGHPSCRNMASLYARATVGAAFRTRMDNGFVASFNHGDSASFVKVACHPAGSIWTEMALPVELLQKHRGLFAAMASSLLVTRTPDPTVLPRPKIEELPLAPSGFSDEPIAHGGPMARGGPKTGAADKSGIDGSGTTEAVHLELRQGPDLRTDEVFERASGAVYVVKADRRLGSAVAISDSELLTNCHIVGDLAAVRIARAKAEQAAQVVSRQADADRCVLRTAGRLPNWVAVRPYDDIRVGERAITIGTPQGLELTAAEGIVSSKRIFNQSRVIQTSAPISQGSSGGGLFDARGNLLGITTFYFRAGQNLNFAVAGEEYVRVHEESASR